MGGKELLDAERQAQTAWTKDCGLSLAGEPRADRTVLAGQAVGIKKEVHDGIWLLSSLEYDQGYFDLKTRVLESPGHPFGPKLPPTNRYILLPMSPGWTVQKSGRSWTLKGQRRSRPSSA